MVPGSRLLAWLAVLTPVAWVGALLPEAVGLAVGLYALLCGAALADAVLGRRRLRGLCVFLPADVRLTRHMDGSIPLRVRKPDGRSLIVALGLPTPGSFETSSDSVRVTLPAGVEESTVAWPCRPLERGRFELDRVYVEALSPLGLWAVRAVCEAGRCELRVYPNLLGERRRLAALFLRRGAFGIHAQRMVGHGREFEKLREYVPGDSFEDIHWKATARRRKPITKVFQVERTREVYAVVDGSRLSARPAGPEVALERYLTAALVLGTAAQQQGDLFGVAAFSDNVNRFVRAGRGRSHFNLCRDALFALEPRQASPDFHELFSFVRTRLRKRALLVVLTDLSDPVHAEEFLKAVEMVCRHHLLLVVMPLAPGIVSLADEPVEPGTDVDRLYERLGGHWVWQGLRQLSGELQRRGVGVALARHDALSGELVSRYMKIKARQSL